MQDTPTLTQRMQSLSSAEDFLAFFGVSYDPPVVHVNRLHILKRFYQYLNAGDLPPVKDDAGMFERQRSLLARAYQDFVDSTPAQERVFKVFQDVGGKQHVGLGALRASLADRRRAGPA